MGYVIYGLDKTRITLFEDDGTTPRYRVTLQKETKEGLRLVFKPEGVDFQLGSGAGWARTRVHRGFRLSLDVKWTHGLESQVETWDGAVWGTPATIPTAQALSVIHTWANHNPCLVSPHQDLNLDFLAQPDPGKGFELIDLKGILHTGLELHLVSTMLMPNVPDWSNLNNYFEAGYIEDGYIGFVP